MKKLLAILLAVMMIAALSAPALAAAEPAETVTVTVTLPDNADTTATQAETFTAYQLFAATETATLLDKTPLAAGDIGITYYTTAAVAANATVADYFDFADGLVGETPVKIATLKENAELNQAAANALLAAAKALGIPGTALEANGTTFSKSLPIGYYVIESSLGANAVGLTTDMTIAQKNEYPSVAKSIDDADKSVQVGENVTFTLTVTVPATVNETNNIILTDTLGAGFTYNNDAASADSANMTAVAEGQVITITVPAADVYAKRGSTIAVTYTALLNADAAVGVEGNAEDGNVNTVVLNYSQFQQAPISVYVDTQTMALKKYDGADTAKANLAGAVFELQDASGNAMHLVGSGTEYRVALKTVTPAAEEGGEPTVTYEEGSVTEFTTVETGDIVIKGLDKDATYKFVEKQAPRGYNKLDSAAISAQAPAGDNTTVVEVANNTGTVLPSTGGIGTTIFYVVGGVLVLAAVVILITKKRLAKEED